MISTNHAGKVTVKKKTCGVRHRSEFSEFNKGEIQKHVMKIKRFTAYKTQTSIQKWLTEPTSFEEKAQIEKSDKENKEMTGGHMNPDEEDLSLELNENTNINSLAANICLQPHEHWTLEWERGEPFATHKEIGEKLGGF